MDFQISEGTSFIRGLSVYMYVCMYSCMYKESRYTTHTHTHTHSGIRVSAITNRKQWFGLVCGTFAYQLRREYCMPPHVH